MEGFHRLEWMDYYVTEKAPGVFLLSNDGEVVLDVGRSDSDIADSLKGLVATPRGIDCKFSYFWFSYTNSSYEAYSMHCKLWHRYHKGDFNVHPKPPEGKDWTCPVDGCEHFAPSDEC